MSRLEFVARCMIYIASPDEDHITEVFSCERLFDHSHGDVTNDFRSDLENELLIEAEKNPQLRGWHSAWIHGHYIFASHETDEECHIDTVRFAPADKIDMEVLGQPYTPPQCFIEIPVHPPLTMADLMTKEKTPLELRVSDANKLVWELPDEPTEEKIQEIAETTGVPVVSVRILLHARRKYEWQQRFELQRLTDLEWLAGHGEGQPLMQSWWRRFRGLFS